MIRLFITFLLFSIGSFAQNSNTSGILKNQISCTISSDKVIYSIGEVPHISVQLENNTQKNIFLVRALDGSDYHWRYPYAYFKIIKIGDTTYKPIKFLRCGNTDDISATDFIELKPNELFNPYNESSIFNTDTQLKNADNFSNPGKYKITFYYSTKEPDFEKWMGKFNEFDKKKYKKILLLFSKVSKMEVYSNDILVEFR